MADVKLTQPTKDATRFAKKVLKANDHFKSKTGSDVPGVDVDHLRELAGAIMDKPAEDMPKPVKTGAEVEEARQGKISKRAQRKVEELKAGKDHPSTVKIDPNLPEHVKKDIRDQNEGGPVVTGPQYEKDPLVRGTKAVARIADKIIHGSIVEEDKGVNNLKGEGVTDRMQQRNELAKQGEIGRK